MSPDFAKAARSSYAMTPFKGLLKAMGPGQGPKISSQKLSPVISYDRTCQEQRQLPERYDVLVVVPWRCKEREKVKGGNWKRDTVYATGRASLYEKDEKERRQRRKEEGEPVIVYAEPRRAKIGSPIS